MDAQCLQILLRSTNWNVQLLGFSADCRHNPGSENTAKSKKELGSGVGFGLQPLLSPSAIADFFQEQEKHVPW
jgi:hypothetical protein